jgi:hypothetical protein
MTLHIYWIAKSQQKNNLKYHICMTLPEERKSKEKVEKKKKKPNKQTENIPFSSPDIVSAIMGRWVRWN